MDFMELQNKMMDQLREDRMHQESIQAQHDLIKSNNKVANEVSGIRESLQIQIDDNREQIKDGKAKDKQLSLRGWIQFGITTAIALGALIVAIISLCRGI